MIICKTPDELGLMRIAGKIVAMAHQLVANNVRPGISTLEIDQIVETFIRSQDAVPSFKGYNDFPASICISINEELVHGIPSTRILNEGDIVTVDIGACYKGYHGDSAWTYPVGDISDTARKLLEVTERSLYSGIAQVKPDVRLYTVSNAIQRCIEEAGYSVVRGFTGHGIGADLHEEPDIPNFGTPDRGPRLKPGMVLAIEPMVNAGERYVRTLDNDWTVVTEDGSLCAHYEHTVAITSEGYEILTKIGE